MRDDSVNPLTPYVSKREVQPRVGDGTFHDALGVGRILRNDLKTVWRVSVHMRMTLTGDETAGLTARALDSTTPKVPLVTIAWTEKSASSAGGSLIPSESLYMSIGIEEVERKVNRTYKEENLLEQVAA